MSASIRSEGLSLLSSQSVDDSSEQGCAIDVVAIHGLNGDPRSTWSCKGPEGEVFWLRDLLPKALPGARIYTYGYDSKLYLSPSTANLTSWGKGLLDHLSTLRDQPSV